VDDGSNDSTPEFLAGIKNPRVEFLRHSSSRGVAAARNTGLACAITRWVAFLDDDDIWSPLKLRNQLDAAYATGASYAYSAAFALDRDRQSLAILRAPDPTTLPRELLRGNVIPGGCSNVVVLTETVRALEGFDQALSEFADWDLWLRLASSGAAAAACNEPLVCHRDHIGNMLRRNKPNVVQEVIHLRRKYSLLGPPLRGALDYASPLRWAASEHFRYGDRATAAKIYLQSARVNASVSDIARALVVLSGPRGVQLARYVRGSSSSVLPPRLAGPFPDWVCDAR
jgi:glycosyltransferase involved in cell wall biosynthesis